MKEPKYIHQLLPVAMAEVRWAQPDLCSMLATALPEISFAIEKMRIDLAASPLLKNLAIASDAMMRFRMTPEWAKLENAVARMNDVAATVGQEIARLVEPLQMDVAGIQARFGSTIQFNQRALAQMDTAFDKTFVAQLESIGARLGAVARSNFGIPKLAMLHWPTNALSHRVPLIEDCILNTVALDAFHGSPAQSDLITPCERLAVATEFAFEHAEVVRSLPPTLPRSETDEQDSQHRAEEIGAKLETALRGIDQRLVELRTNAWRNLSGGIVGARLAMTGIRELFDEVLRCFAPDSEVEATEMWQNREDRNISKPTRRMRLNWVLGEAEAAEADALLQFQRSINRTQKFVHSFAENPELVRAQMSHLEIWIYLLVHYGMRRPRSN